MSIKMMPPKKSKAARSDNLETNEKVEEKPEPAAEMSDDVQTDEEPVKGVPPKKKHFNMFEITTVEGKRKRNITATPESSLSEWIDEHFVEKTEVKLPYGELYNIYLEKCVTESSTAVEPVFFNKIMRKSFPIGFSFKESSPYLNKVKEKKVKKKEPKVKADTLSIKIRDIIENSLTEMGNPKGGVRFNKLVNFVAGKYPALRIELRPKMLLTALQRGIRYGYLVCERGIGKCGFYRRYVEDEPDEEIKEEDKENQKDDKRKKDDKKEKDDKAEDKDGEKSAEDSADDAPEKDKDNVKNEKKEAQNDKSPAKKKAKKRTNKPRFIHHGHPSRVEDTFYLAMTFMSEPKEASVIRIKKYVAENYPDTNVDRLARCMEAGKERGYWEQVSGTSGSSGKFRLEVDSFDPTDDEDMTGMVINAIMACTEPKMCSANLLKKYVMEWYSDRFKVAERPHLFKKALDRAVANGEIKQLSGIGATGTFQLTRPFIPSPIILAGQDTPSDYEGSDSDTSDEGAVETYDYSGYGDKYKPRPSKRRGMARSKAVHAKPAVEIKEEAPKKRKKRAAGSTSRKRSRYTESDSSSSEESSDESSSESESEEEEKPVKKGGRGRPSGKAAGGKAASAGRGKRKASPAKKTPVKRGRGRQDPDSDDESEDESPKKRGTKTKASAKASNKKAAASRGRDRGRVSYRESSSGDESDTEKVVDGYKPTPSRSRGGERARPTVEATPKTTSRGRSKKPAEPPMPTGRVRTPAAKKQGDARYSSDSESMTNDRPTRMVETPAAKKQRSATAPRSRRRR